MKVYLFWTLWQKKTTISYSFTNQQHLNLETRQGIRLGSYSFLTSFMRADKNEWMSDSCCCGTCV